MKLLKDILYRVRIEQVVGSTNSAVEKVAFDDRQVVAFTAFVAVKGTKADGHAFIGKAIDAGARAIICEVLPDEQKDGVTYVRVANSADIPVFTRAPSSTMNRKSVAPSTGFSPMFQTMPCPCAICSA